MALFRDTGNHWRLSEKDLGDLIRPLLDGGRPCRFVSGGHSMHPFIQNRDSLTLSPLNRRPVPGDILACLLPVGSSIVVHRVIKTKPGYVEIKGDNNTRPDGWIPESLICGRVTAIERKGRSVRLGLGPEKALLALAGRRHVFMRILALPVKVWARGLRLVSGD